MSSSRVYTFTVTGNTVINAVFSGAEAPPSDVSITPGTTTVDAATPVYTATASSDVTLMEGSNYAAKTVTLTASVGTAGIPNSYTYQWYKDGTDISGATSASYTTEKLYTAGTYTYRCDVSNGVGAAVSATATVTVKAINWKLKVLKSTSLKFTQMPGTSIDVFLVGGGGSGVRAPLTING